VNIIGWLRDKFKSKDPAKKTSYVPLAPLPVEGCPVTHRLRMFQQKRRAHNRNIARIASKSRMYNYQHA